MNQNKNQNKKRTFSIGKLFQSNRFVLVFSVFAAIVLWFIMAFNNTENRARVIYDIPIDTTLSDEAVAQDLRVFEVSDETARVSVTGNSFVVNQLSSGDIKVSASLTSNITRAGTYTLNLTATKNSDITDYEFDTIYPGSIILFVDKYVEKTFTVEQHIEYFVADGYYADSPALEETKITFSGPETEVSAIDLVAVEKKIDGQLKEPTSFEQALTFYDKQGNKITDMGHMEASFTAINVKIEVLKMAELPVTVTYKNLPDGVDLSGIVSVNPTTLKIGSYVSGKEDAQKEINLQPINMAEVTPQNTTFSVDFEMPEHCTNISGAKHATVKFDLSNYTSQTYTIDNLVLSNVPSGMDATIDTDQLEVTVVGPTSKLKKLKAGDLYAEIDLSGKEDLQGSVAVPVKIHVDSKYGAWAAGEYTAYVTIMEG